MSERSYHGATSESIALCVFVCDEKKDALNRGRKEEEEEEWNSYDLLFILIIILKQTRLKQDNYNIHIFDNKYFSSITQDKSKLQKQTSKLLILIVTAAW